MKAARFHAREDLRIEDIQEPELRPGTVIRRTGLPVRRLPFVRPLPGTISLEVTTAV